MKFVLRSLLALMFVEASVGACSSGNDMVPVEVIGYNHTDKYIHMFTVNEGGGGNAFAHSGGGSFVCCVSVPKHWRPGLQAKVRWMNEDDSWNETVVGVPKYGADRTGNFNVHFMRDGTVKVFVTTYSLWNPAYPLKGKEAEL
jgi:hypothetical protein